MLVFHQTGTGGSSMEELIKTGLVEGVLDVTPTELVGEIAGGVWPAGPDRLEVAGRLGHPAGRIARRARPDRDRASRAVASSASATRWIYRHDEHMAGARTTAEESAQLAR